ncbi:MAG: hypothetical protein ACJASC_000483 [Limimaricola cinnabarinus]|jgi:hypothetical protein|uniref:hypothetical protein n=1 Tax=Limimaricola cinnabarinus TaxID=1125964 RepID=UPI0039E4E937
MTTAETHSLLDDLGLGRMIWIDDFFEASVDRIKNSLMRDPAPLLDLGLKGFGEVAALSADDDKLAQFEEALITALNAASQTDLATLNAAIRNRAARQENEQSDVPSPDEDLPSETILAACEMLRVDENDRLGFEAGLAFLESLDEDEAQKVSFVVDLQDAFQVKGIGATAGVTILKKIYTRGRSETVFILTHEAEIASEAAKEDEIAEALVEELSSKPLPCVISKQRISVTEQADLASGIQVALKRASLRQEVYRVGQAAEKHAASAVAEARKNMCRIPPEELDNFFVARAIRDGASDLHMIERIYSAQVEKSVRHMFVEDSEVKSAVSRIRRLRDVPLQTPASPTHPAIAKFRLDEMWLDGNFLQTSFSPLSLGDIFQTNDAAKRQFILLGQLCDLTLREDGNRAAFSSDLVHFKPIAEPEKKLKTIDLKVGPDGGFMRFDFNSASPANLRILDLASMNKDGAVKISTVQAPEAGMLPGQRTGLEKTLKLLKAVLGNEKAKAAEITKAHARCQLTMKIDNPFNGIAKPSLTDKNGVKELSWNLIRTGRLQSPYIDQLMDRQLMLVGRRALDIEYLPE